MSRKPGTCSRVRRLTDSERQRLLRALQAEDAPPLKYLAKRFGVSAEVVSRIKREHDSSGL